DQHHGDVPEDLSPRDLQHELRRRKRLSPEPGTVGLLTNTDLLRPRRARSPRDHAGKVHGGASREAAPSSSGTVGRQLPCARRLNSEGSTIMQKMLPTSIVGSLPKPSWLAQPETLWSPWNLRDDALAEGQQDALRVAVHEQRGRGID